MAKQSRRKCLFCGEYNKMSREHLLPQWMWRLYGSESSPGTESWPFRWDEQFSEVDGELRQTYIPREDRPYVHSALRTIRLVCTTCNNGWMSDLEGQVQGLSNRLATERTWVLSAEEIALLRRWLQKTALMLERYDSTSLMSDSATYSAAYRNKKLPGTWYCGLGRLRVPSEPWVGSTPLIQAMRSDGGPIVEQMYGLQHIIQFDRFLFVVRHSVYRAAPGVRLDHDVRQHPSGPFIPLNEHIADVRWRREKIANLDAESVQDLVNQWGHPTRAEEGFSLLGDGEERWLGLTTQATASQFSAPFQLP